MTYYYSKRLCEGGDLLTAISKLKQLSQLDVAKIMKQLLSAVNYCHARNIVHRYFNLISFTKNRDIKLENILFEEQNIKSSVIKVIDFGRSKILQIQQRLTELAGSVF